jgi:putative heme iron utilization protein
LFLFTEMANAMLLARFLALAGGARALSMVGVSAHRGLAAPAAASALLRRAAAAGSVRMMAASTEAAKEEEAERLGAGGRGGHAVKNQPEISEEEKALQAKVMEHQAGAPRLSNAEETRSLLQYSTGFATLSTLSKQFEGFPSGSVVGFAPDEQGLPVFCFSAMSGHTQDLLVAPDGSPASLTVTAAGFKGAADGRVTLMGKVRRCAKEEAEPLRELYKAKHPGAFWVDFGDFTWFRMSELVSVRFIGGFARAGEVSPEDYVGASVDPIQAFAAPVMKHMNDDHAESTVAMVEHYVGIDQVESATLVGMDRLGMTAQVARQGQTFKLRLPFPRGAEDRKDVKTLIVEMTRASAQQASDE